MTKGDLPHKTRVLDALIAGGSTMRAVCATTGLEPECVKPILSRLRRDGVIQISKEYGDVGHGRGRPGHIYKIAGAKHG